MLFRCLFIIGFILGNSWIANGQTKELAGLWKGLLSQNNRGIMYDVVLKIQYESDSTVFGTSKIVMNDGKYVEFDFEGKVQGDSLLASDIGIISEKGSSANWAWCVKQYLGKLTYVNGQWILEGPWMNEGNLSYTQGEFHTDKFQCNPGKFRLIRQKTPLESGEKTRYFQRRKVEVQKIIETESDSVEIAFFDNNVIDDDTITIFYRGELLVKKHRLSEDSLVFYVKINPLEDNELIIYANNVGSIPPNTAAMVLNDNARRVELSINCDSNKNASVIIRRRKKE